MSLEADEENKFPPSNLTTLTLPIDVVPGNKEKDYTLLWSQKSVTCHELSDVSGCSHPAKTILRPRSGYEYVIIKREAKFLTTTHMKTSTLGKQFNFDSDHNDTLSVLSYLMSTPQNSPTFSSFEDTIRSVYPDLWSHQSASATPSPCPSFNHSCPSQHSAKDLHHKTKNSSDVFCSAGYCSSASPPPSPYQPKSSSNYHNDYPIYVNQDFTGKHIVANSRTVSSSSSHSSVSPVRSSLHSMMFSTKQNSINDLPSSQPKRNDRSRHSDPDPGKLVNFHFSLPNPSSASSAGQCNTDKVLQKEYDKFANSSIISRRRHQCPSFSAEDQRMVEPNSNPLLQVPQVKSSGYKNIDSFNAASALDQGSVFTETTPIKYWTLATNPRMCHSQHLSSLSNSTVTPSKMASTADVSQRLPELKSSVSEGYNNSKDSLPFLCDPPPPIRSRQASSSSSSSLASSPCLSPVDGSDSPPSYYAPSPPSTPPLPLSSPIPPVVPPRQRVVPPPSPSEKTADFSDEEGDEDEQELNYIEVDMRKTSGEPVSHPPTVHYRPSKRGKKKDKDSAKLRYVLIDHSATKALQEARQEHVQARDNTQMKSTSHLNRINSAPASSKKKHFTFISRERKDSSGSIESY